MSTIVSNRPIHWNGTVVYAVLESRLPARSLVNDLSGTALFNGFANAGYIGSYQRTDQTDRLVARALNFLGWTPAMFVTWAESTRGRYFLDYEPETVEEAVKIMQNDAEDVRRWMME